MKIDDSDTFLSRTFQKHVVASMTPEGLKLFAKAANRKNIAKYFDALDKPDVAILTAVSNSGPEGLNLITKYLSHPCALTLAMHNASGCEIPVLEIVEKLSPAQQTAVLSAREAFLGFMNDDKSGAWPILQRILSKLPAPNKAEILKSIKKRSDANFILHTLPGKYLQRSVAAANAASKRGNPAQKQG